MPIRISSVTRRLQKNGARLHQAMMSRAHQQISPGEQGADQPPSAEEQALLDERRMLKELRAQRQAQALLPKVKAVRPVREPKPPRAPKAPKAASEPKEGKDAKGAKGNKESRAARAAKKAEALDAARRATKKSAKT